MSSQNAFNWAPLESDPAIFTEYFRKLGLPENFIFNELYTIDYKEVQPIDGEVLSVIINYESNKANPLIRKQENFVDYKGVPFYMRQIEELDYACGVIAGLHAIGNNLDKIKSAPSTLLSEYFGKIEGSTSEDRAKLLCSNKEIKSAHETHANMGQTIVEEPNKVQNHFVAFNYLNGKIYEFDGMLKTVYLIKDDVSKENFFDDTLAEISNRLNNQHITENLSILFLSKL